MSNVLRWFEIPCTDLAKSQAFYEAVLACHLHREAMGPSQGAIFPYDKEKGNMGGALMCGPSAPDIAPGSGVLVYFNGGNDRMSDLLTRVQAAGGSVAMPSQDLPRGMGTIAHIVDPDGNRIGLHTMVP